MKILPTLLRDAILLIVSLIPTLASALDFSVSHTNPFTRREDPIDYFVLSGEIRPGDYDRMMQFAITNRLNLIGDTFVLKSPGGDVSEAMAIGQFVKSIYAQVGVGPAYGPCASSCFIIVASAVKRWIEPGLLGIHRPYIAPERTRVLSPTVAEALELKAMANAESYLRSLRVPSSIIDTMFANSSEEIHWLTEGELERLGLRAPWFQEYVLAQCGLSAEKEKAGLSSAEGSAANIEIKNLYACEANATYHDAAVNWNMALKRYGHSYPVPKE